jgi:hypothetical protein
MKKCVIVCQMSNESYIAVKAEEWKIVKTRCRVGCGCCGGDKEPKEQVSTIVETQHCQKQADQMNSAITAARAAHHRAVSPR